ncbi:type IX secretion system protein PorG [Bizionia arctica]|uniref:DUF6089 domain-containing protein n=1 Tax=Bizionia arctica TaxID=1495645 RepID=A0A917LK17_9FLAO|nr:DUF6089 family protein [Bizionia arctica]GGG33727.1 hypothetical protein GCM10010976_01830 [Bizionia arctica]
MRYLTTIFLFILTFQLSQAQTHELGVFVGGSNFIGDVGATTYISPNQIAFGGVYKWNRSPRHSFRLSLLYTDLEINDLKSDDPKRQQRGYQLTNDLVEASLGIEFNFLDFDLHDGTKKATPYLYSGISVAHYDNFYFTQNGQLTSEGTSSFAFGIPMVLGFKYRFMGNFIIAAEIGARYTFSDEIDGSAPDYDHDANTAFGNKYNNDWYMITGVTLTYTFGRKPCYCVF